MDGKLFGIGELYFVALSYGGIAKDLTSKMGLMKVGPRSEATGFRRPANIEYVRLALTAIDRLQRAGWEVSGVWTPGGRSSKTGGANHPPVQVHTDDTYVASGRSTSVEVERLGNQKPARPAVPAKSNHRVPQGTPGIQPGLPQSTIPTANEHRPL